MRKKIYEELIIRQGLIDYQKAEIERLKCEMGKLLPKDCSYAMQMEVSNKLESQIKSEAMKECLARVKNYIKTHCNPYGKPDFDYDTSIKILIFIDNLVKEMTDVEVNQKKEYEKNG